jgi:ectoine hydroxylase-related dioxygenase (phytanoyl-CoA dioxygenase family)
MNEKQINNYLAQIAEDGYCIIENVLSPEQADAIAEEVRELEQALATQPYANVFEGAKTKRIYNLLTQGPTFWDIAINPLVLPVVEGVLDEGLLVSSLSTIHIGPGEIPQPIHVDDGIINLELPHPPLVCNTMYALTDFTEENGATRIIPGSHKLDTAPEFGKHYDSIPAEMSKGSVLVWPGNVWHGGGENNMPDDGPDSWRMGLAMNYCAGFIRQQENQQLGIPMDMVRTFPPRLQELIGFAPYQGVIGHIDRQSPMAMLDETNTHSLANVFPPSAEE